MERQIERGCGLDVHRDTVAACVRVPGRGQPREQHVRTFGTTVAALWQLRAWLEEHGVTNVTMESTGVYWKPVFYVLEEAVRRSRACSSTPRCRDDLRDGFCYSSFRMERCFLQRTATGPKESWSGRILAVRLTSQWSGPALRTAHRGAKDPR